MATSEENISNTVTHSVMEKKNDYWCSIRVAGLENTFCPFQCSRVTFELTNLPKNKMTTNNVQWTFTACPFSAQAISLLRNESNWWTAFIQLVQKLQRLISLFLKMSSFIRTNHITGHSIFIIESQSSLSWHLPSFLYSVLSNHWMKLDVNSTKCGF